MSIVRYRANLGAKSWPLVSTYFGRSVIVGSAGRDQNFNRQTISAEDPDKDIGIPQAYYQHNVMPTSQGVQSVGYVPLISPPRSSSGIFSSIFNLHFATGSAYLSILDNGDAYILNYGGSPQWYKINSIASIVGRLVTQVSISGVCYVYVQGVGCYQYDPTILTLNLITLSGLDPALIIGITGAVGYMIAWSATGIAWSSTLDPTDFVPSLITGAGGGGVEQAKGPITLCISNSLGFIIYTQYNAVVEIYSGNARFPFNARELANVGGITNPNLIAVNVSDSAHFAYTTVGLESVSPTSSQIIFPEVTDFISGKVFEDFDEVTNTLTQTPVVTMNKLLTIISNRYLVLSYGITELTHALVYDTEMKRWGKLKHTHVDCFEWLLYPEEITEIPKQGIGFLHADGSISRLDVTSLNNDSVHKGVLILGKYQYVRARALDLEEVTIENIVPGANFTLQDMISYKGKQIDRIVDCYLQPESIGSGAYTYNVHKVGLNHSLLLKGAFYAVSLELSFTTDGDR